MNPAWRIKVHISSELIEGFSSSEPAIEYILVVSSIVPSISSVPKEREMRTIKKALRGE
jgi:hypothetical protein